jgi:hypothetical protein
LMMVKRVSSRFECVILPRQVRHDQQKAEI